MSAAPRVDAHHHVWDLSVRDQEWTREFPLLHRSYGLDDLRPLLTQCAIRATVVVQTLNVAEETPELLSLAKSNPVVAGVVGWVDLCAHDVAGRLARLKELPGGQSLVGIRHLVQDEADEQWLARPDVLRGLGDVADADLVYDLLVRPHQIPAALVAVKSTPNLRFVLDHFGKPPIAAGQMEPWRSQMSELARCENVVVKFSGLVTEADHQHWQPEDLRAYVEVILSTFGPSRVMFGSDWPVCQLAASYERVLSVAEELTHDLSGSERDDLFGQTAIRWYGLDLA